MSKRKQHHPEIKAKVALEVPKRETEMNLDLMRAIHCAALAACRDERG